MNAASQNSTRAGLLVIFVLSGFAGLIYQSIWSHYLGLFLGHAAYAQALVLAIFMGGMAAGAAWIAKAGEHWRNLIRGYAVIEIIIGVLGLLFHALFTNVAAFSYDTLIPALGHPEAINLMRWVVAAVLILPQTILLGMTFPLMSGGLIRRFPQSQGRLLGGLYFTNSIGAAAGALIAVFVLLPRVGLPGAMVAAATMNFLVALLAWWLARHPEPTPAPAESIVDRAATSRLSQNPLLRAVLLGTALSGAASFVYEIVWIRMLSMAVGSTMHAFELMLAAFIAGIALGGLWVRKRADTTQLPLQFVGWMQVGKGLAALASLAVYASAFAWVGWLIQSLAKTDGGYALFNLGTASIAIAIMLPAAFFAGTTLPLFTVTLLRARQGERAIGRVYAWNTLGSIVGVFAAVHLLIPTIGLKLTLCMAALLDLAIGLVLLRREVVNPRAMRGFGVALALAAIAMIAAVRIPFDPMQLASGVFRHGRTELDKDSKVIYLRDGKTASVSVAAYSTGTVVIATNGKPDAGIMMRDDGAPASDEPTMVLLGSLPLALHDRPERVGVIGFGSGLTTHTLLGDSRVRQVDTVEIEPAMVDGARAFGTRVSRAHHDARSNVVIDDAKTYFAGQRQKYDVIISEPSNPWISGVGSLFTKEFYRFIPRNLNDDGLFVQWVHLYEIDESLIGSILNAMVPEFNDYAVWLTNQSDLVIVASPKGKVPDPQYSRLLQGPLGTELARLGLTSEEHLAFRKIADSRVLRGMTRLYDAKPVNSDYLPVLGLYAPATRFKGILAADIMTLPDQGASLLEALGVRKPLHQAAPSALSHFAAEASTRQARALAARLSGAPTNDLMAGLNPYLLGPAVLLEDAARSLCQRPLTNEARQAFFGHLRQVADLTISFLPPTMLEGVWAQPQWLPCRAAVPADLAQTLALLQAQARRDYAAMEQLGRAWLATPTSNDAVRQEFDQVALSHLLLSLAHQGRWTELPEAERQYGANVNSLGHHRTQRMLLLAMANE